MPSAAELTGVWAGNDDSLYYIRGLTDGTVAWAGLTNTGFHKGTESANVFHGTVAADGGSISGTWADVPRGLTQRSGTLKLRIAPALGLSGIRRLSRETAGTTGGFSASLWETGLVAHPLLPQDIVSIESRVRRYDKPLGENNPPGRDFTVMWGTVPSVDHPSRPPWYPANDYCKFVQAADGWGGDGDFDFHIEPDWARTGSSFWTDGWLDRELGSLPANSYILQQFSNYGFFNCEAPMYARENTKSVSDCSGPPRMLLPAWFEQGGNSILVNGRPINGNVVDIVDGSGAKALQFNLGPHGRQVVELTAGATVRVTGVVADDTGHDNPPPEIHPLYAIDVVHVVRRIVGPPVTGGPSLTGAWHADDIGTYYLRQLGDTVWWLGLSSDQGRTFATVFHGSLAGGTISGEWIDVPMGQEPQLGNGTLGVSGGTLATVLRAQSSGYRAATWTKLYDVLPPPPVFEP